MKRKTKKQERLEAKFDEAMAAHLQERGATTNEGKFSGWYVLSLPTRAGPLVIKANGTWLAMRFVDIDRAKAILPHGQYDQLNGYSGKYNIHYGEIHDLDCCKRVLDHALRDVAL